MVIVVADIADSFQLYPGVYDIKFCKVYIRR